MMFNDDNSSESSSPEPKSAYLTIEDIDKIQARRAKNRAAAKVSRHRKKAKLERLESGARVLRDKNNSLKAECSSLKEFNRTLVSENSDLRRKISRAAAANYILQGSSRPHKEQIKYASLSADTLLELWQQVSAVDIPECECNE